MKSFVSYNLHRSIIAFSSIIFSFACLIFALKNNVAQGQNLQNKSGSTKPGGYENIYVVASGKNLYEVKKVGLSDEYEIKFVGSTP